MQPDPARRTTERPLTPRMIQVISCLAEGKTLPQIAVVLKISIHTARNYATRSYERLGVSNRTEAVVAAIRSGIISL
jgi:DNA-binding NarL/FixJ family response regulator